MPRELFEKLTDTQFKKSRTCMNLGRTTYHYDQIPLHWMMLKYNTPRGTREEYLFWANDNSWHLQVNLWWTTINDAGVRYDRDGSPSYASGLSKYTRKTIKEVYFTGSRQRLDEDLMTAVMVL